MTAFRTSLIIEGDGSGAQAAVQKTAKATRDLGKAGDEASRGTRRLASASDAAETQVRGLASAQAQATASAQRMGAANVRAAGSVGNLTAQFNDIGVMMAAGQNPLQLALQQGTQITQVFGQAGGAGAVRMLGTAFLSMLSPLNLITIGSIAAGAALTQWLLGAGEEVATLEDGIDGLTDAVDRYRSAVEAARASPLDLQEQFGPDTAGAREALAVLEELARLDALDAMAAATGAIETRFDGLDLNLQMIDVWRRAVKDTGDGLRRAELRDYLDDLESGFNLSEVAARNLKSAVDDALAADTPQETLAALGALREAMSSAPGPEGGEDATRWREIARAVAEAELQLRAFVQTQTEATGDQGAAQSLDFFTAAAEAALRRGEAEASAAEQARAMLATMQEQNAIAQAIRDHGAGSAQVAELRASAERRALQALIDAMNVSNDLKAELTAAANEAYRLSAANFGNIASAVGQAAALAAELRAAAAAAEMVSANTAPDTTGLTFGLPGTGDPTTGDAKLTFGPNPGDRTRRSVIDLTSPSGGSRGGGGAAAEADAVQDLIDRLREELEIVRETDPVQQELLRHREALTDATAAERAEVEQLIRQRIEEERWTTASAEASDFFAQTLFDGLQSLREEGGGVIDMLENIANAIAEAALQAALLGTGPLAELFGTADTGGAFGQIFSAIFGSFAPANIPGQAVGGPVYGAGTGTSDEVLRRLSNGEFVVNALAAQRNRHLLEVINAGGEVPGMSSGGFVAPPPPPPPSNRPVAPGAVHFAPVIQIDNRSSQPIAAGIEETRGTGGQRSYRLVLSDQVGAAMRQPGGGADKVLQNQYGVRKQGTAR